MTRTLSVASLAALLSGGCSENAIYGLDSPPSVWIVSPPHGTVAREGDVIELSGTTSDEPNSMQSLTTRWYSGGDVVCYDRAPDPDGTSTCEVPAVPGAHVFTFEVIDSSSQGSQDRVAVTVVDDLPPTAVITWPAPGSTVGVEPLALSGTAADGETAGPELRAWFESDVDGVFPDVVPASDGAVGYTAKLSPGAHHLTLWVEDPLGQQSSDAVDVIVGVETCNGLDDDADGQVDEGLNDDDRDGVCNALDVCAAGDDATDADADTVPDACDVCPDADDTADGDADAVPDACDICPAGDDALDADGDGLPDACDPTEVCNGIDDDANGAIDDGVACGCDWQSWDGHAYLFCDHLQSWGGAQVECASKGYSLVSIGDDAENDFVSAATSAVTADPWWIGATDEGHEAVWTWIGGEPFTWTDWLAGAPDGALLQNCASLAGAPPVEAWDDVPCGDAYRFVCEAGL